MTDATLNPPTRRVCLDCGREDVWDDEDEEWRIRVEDGERRTGEPYCLHDWDINGTHRPVTE